MRKESSWLAALAASSELVRLQISAVDEEEGETGDDVLTTQSQGAAPLLTTLKKKEKIFLIYEDIQNGTVTKPYLRMGFLIYE